MTDLSAAPDDTPDITATLQALMPDLRRHTRQGWALIGAVCLVAAAISFLVVDTWEWDEYLQWLILGLVLGGALVFALAARTRRAHEAAIMPILTRTVGLDYQKDASRFLKSLPTRLLPGGLSRKSEDLLYGRIGGRAIQMAEVKIATGGKDSRNLFQGLVINFKNAVAMPPFFIAETSQTEKSFWLGNRLDVEGLVQIRTVIGQGRPYGVWAASTAVADHPGLSAVLAVLTDLPWLVGSNAELFSATSDGEQMHIALTHKRDLYRIGGLFASQDAIMAGVQAAYGDLKLPLTIASRLMDAEKSVGEGVKKG